MTIKQYGGVFGRNPTFNNVTVDGTLTVDQIVEKTGAAGITLDGVTLKDGNVVLANGKGIDFSATAGTGTSELFDDYEEGTWTPTYATTGTAFDSVTYDTGFTEGTYTKIGNMVNVRMYIRTDALTVGSASGTVKIDGLPFTCASDRNAVGCFGGLFAGDNPRVARAVSNSIFLYYRTGGNTADTPLAPSDMGTGANNNDVILSLCYQTS